MLSISKKFVCLSGLLIFLTPSLWAQAPPPADAQTIFTSGMAHAQAGRHREAAADFQRVTQLRSDSFEAFFNLGFAYARAGKRQEAIAAFQKAVNGNSQPAEAIFQLGQQYVLAGDNVSARLQYDALKSLGAEKEAALLMGLINR